MLNGREKKADGFKCRQFLAFCFTRTRCLGRASWMAQWIKNFPAVQETQEMWVQSLGWEDPLEEKKRQPTPVFLPEESHDRGASQATVHGVTKSWTQLSRSRDGLGRATKPPVKSIPWPCVWSFFVQFYHFLFLLTAFPSPQDSKLSGMALSHTPCSLSWTVG